MGQRSNMGKHNITRPKLCENACTKLNKTIGEEFEDTLKNDIGVLGIDLSEAALDSILDNDIIDRLPVFATIKRSKEIWGSISNRIFAKKLVSFLMVSSEIDEGSRCKIIEKIDRDSKYRTRVGETLVNLLERSKDAENAKQIALLFKKLVENCFGYDDFLRCVEVVIRVSDASLRDFILLDQKDIPSNSMDELLYSGLYRQKITPQSVEVKDDEELKFEERQKEFEENLRSIQFSPFLRVPELELSNPGVGDGFNDGGKYHTFLSGGEMVIEKTAIGEIISLSLEGYYDE